MHLGWKIATWRRKMMSPCGSQNPSEGSNIECQFQHASFLPFDAGGFEIGSNRAPGKKKTV